LGGFCDQTRQGASAKQAKQGENRLTLLDDSENIVAYEWFSVFWLMGRMTKG
jgi:hypothetical protein